MIVGPWYVWTGRLNSSIFDTFQDALAHCRAITVDHRRKYELDAVVTGVHRYVGPRGRRHGTRLVAFICTGPGAALIGIDVKAIYGQQEGARA